MTLCDLCAQRDTTCPEPGPAVHLCVEFTPLDRDACRAAQDWYARAGRADADAWRELCRLIEIEVRYGDD